MLLNGTSTNYEEIVEKEVLKLDSTNLLKFLGGLNDENLAVAIINNPCARKYLLDINPDLLERSERIWIVALQKEGGYIFNKYLETVKNIKYNVCLEAVKYNSSFIYEVPEELIDHNMVLTSVSYHPNQINISSKDSIKDYLCDEIFMAAVKTDGKVIRFVPDTFMTRELVIEAVKQNGRAISYIDRKYMEDSYIQEKAICSKPSAVKILPYDLQTSYIWYYAVRQKPELFKVIPKHCISELVCRTAVNLDVTLFPLVPEEYRENCRFVLQAHTRELQDKLLTINSIEVRR